MAKRSQETCEKIRIARTGTRHSPETIRKMMKRAEDRDPSTRAKGPALYAGKMAAAEILQKDLNTHALATGCRPRKLLGPYGSRRVPAWAKARLSEYAALPRQPA